MYRLIIADDEYMIRQSLASLVDWESLGFQVVLLARDGEEALRALDGADVVLSDVQMPKLSGLDLAQRVFEDQLPVRVVIISGYREFEYARRAIAYNVSDYLLKPIDLACVTSVFERIRADLDREQAEKQKQQSYRNELSLYRTAATEKFFELARLGLFKQERDAIAYLNRFGLTETLSRLLVHPYQLCFTDAARDEPIPQEVVANILVMLQTQHELPLSPILFPGDEQKYEVLLFTDPSEKRAELDAFCTDAVHAFRDVCNAGTRMAPTGTARPLTDFACVREQPAERQELDKEEILLSMARQHLIILNTAPELEETTVSLTEIFCRLTAGEPEPEKRRHAERLLEHMGRLVSKQLPDFPTLFASSAPREISSSFEEWYQEELKRFCACMKQERRAHSSLVELVQAIIKSHITENISLQQVADQVFISPNYLSRLFKEETGENFSEFTIRVKMEKAAELLRDPTCRVYEVNETLGYKSLQHFYKLFKRVFDCTPTEYREKVLRQHKRTDEKEP